MKLNDVQKLVLKFVNEREKELRKFDFIVGVSRGGLIPAALIAARLDKPLVVVYIDKRGSVYLDRKAWLRGKRVLLVDDIVRTGATMKKMFALVKSAGVRELKSYTVFCLRSAAERPFWTKLVSRDKKMPWDL